MPPAERRYVGLFPRELKDTGRNALTVVCIYAPNSSLEYPGILEALGWALERALPGDSIILLGDLNAHVGNDGVTGKNYLPNLNPSRWIMASSTPN